VPASCGLDVRLGFTCLGRPRTPLFPPISLRSTFFPRFHDIRIPPYHKATFRHCQAVHVEIRIKPSAVAEVAVARCDVVGNATHGEGTLEDGRATCAFVALVVDSDACPAEHVAGVVKGAGSIRTHTLFRDVRRDDLSPVRFDRGWKEWFRVRDDTLARRVGIIVDDARRRVYEVVIWAEMEVKSFAEGGECQSEGVSVV
jgi:hypothetical protein